MMNLRFLCEPSCLAFLAMMFAFCSSMENSDIILDESRPDMFYCPTRQYGEKEKKIVTALPITRLCQYGPGGKRPPNTPGDCYNDVDESPIACDEKSRFLVQYRRPQSLESSIFLNSKYKKPRKGVSSNIESSKPRSHLE